MAPEREESRWLDALSGAMGPQWTVGRIEDFDPVDVEVAAIAPPLRLPLSTFPNLALIQSLWAGVESILRDPGLRTDIPLARMKDEAMEKSMQASIVSHVLSHHLHHDVYRRQQQRARWNQIYGVPPSDRSVTFLGLGAMALPAARTLVDFGFDVTAIVRHPDRPRSESSPTLVGTAELPHRLAETDVVVNVLPVTSETENIIDAEFLSNIKTGGALVNVARGVHVVDRDLLAALDSGRLRHAYLDVFRTEPLPPDHPFWSHDHITITPHMAAPTFPTSGARFVRRQLERFIDGSLLEHLVDHDAGY